ncbi:nitrite/sulfite reductase [Clostridium butyricum]|uniref:nitrite/sulfite reductase n=1 Tax=Clostridium butyricum TaxID=1492 RepID=UPI002908C4EF|nr:nitrite/sulfite reductase [Clostridium butyricum]MDU5819747.1 nitrite/sulfite reductase [Clostridium butyricum]
MNKLKDELIKEIEQFRELGHRFLNGDVSVMEFKHASGGMGAYAERSKNTFMVRLRIPSGITDINELRWVCKTAEKYGLEKIHFTTREAIQYHNLSIDDICDIMKEALEHNIYTRGAGGNFPRNVAMSPLAGVDKFEAFDVTPYALAVNNYFLQRITSYKLPRKIKVSFSSSNMDAGHCNITDLGFLAVTENNKEFFKVYLGGGLGQNPRVGIALGDLINPSEVLYYVEAMVQMFIAEGDYNNRAKARIRYILDRMGEEEFINCYKKHLSIIKEKEDLTLNLSPHTIKKEGIKTHIKNNRLIEQKQDGLYSVYFHPIGGQISVYILEKILNLIDGMKDISIRLTMTEGMYIRNLNGEEAEKLLNETQNLGGETHLEQSISCIGVPTCQIGLLESQKMLNEIIEYFKEKNYTKDVLPRIHISGCGNSCGIHEACLIGLTGKKKKVNDELQDTFEIHINGSFEEGSARLGKVYGQILAKEIPEFLYELSLLIEKKNINFHDFIDKYENELEDLVDKYKK